MRLADFLGVLAALVVGGIVTVLLLANVIGEPATLITPSPPTIPPLPSLSGAGSPTPVASQSAGASGEPANGVTVGQPAPPLTVTLTDGSLLDTRDYAGQPLWINFMASWCPQCADELPMMQHYQAQLGDQATLILVDVGEDARTVRSFAHSLGIELPVGVDSDSSIQQQWGAYALPVHYFIDGNGVVQQIVFGGAPPEVFDQALGDILTGATPSPGS
jgi:cytochrome c biogenesis protein CcmG, thiol:disulfide interchange protein DsbE